MLTGDSKRVRLDLTENAGGLERQDYVALGVLFLFAFSLRLIRLFDLDLIFDEAVLLLQARESFAGIWALCKSDNFPPLYSWLIKLWMDLGSGVPWFRLFGALLGSLTAPAAYLLVRELNGRKLAWGTGILCAISAVFLYYSQFVRMYNVQAFLVCLSLYWFIKALKTGHWRYWLLTSLANLLGYYVYVFMLFVFLAELLLLAWYFRLDLKAYLRPFLSHVPFFAGVLLWVVPTLQRYSHVQEAFWTPPLTWQIFRHTMVSFGTFSDFHQLHWLEAALNIPIYLGFILGLGLKPRKSGYIIPGLIVLVVGGIIFSISLGSRSFFHDRYLVYVMPLFLAVMLAGWSKIPQEKIRTVALVLIFLIFAGSMVYYYIDFYYLHIYVGLVRDPGHTQPGEGHGLSLTAAEVAQKIKPEEVIIHYSEPYLRICSYFSALVYHQRALPEYIYSSKEIEQHNGRQYLRPGDWIKSLSDLKSPPQGIWLFTMNLPEEVVAERPPRWVYQENLPLELKDHGYQPDEIITHFKASAIHYVRKTEAGAP